MTSERWLHIDRLFHSTLECSPDERPRFLTEACGDDDDLRLEVESLLLSHEREGNFLDLPAYEVAPEFLADGLVDPLIGQQIGPYKILSLIDAGGMGEVYLAHDARLGRKIALKLLPPDFARDQYRVRRFVQEARAASALNHPNVCVVYEIGQTNDGRQFIAMEHIDGVTLRDRIRQGQLHLGETLVVADQIAAALTAAHDAGVVHRDIKPENIMVRTDGYVKVLDFGLAKLNENQSSLQSGNEASTIAKVLTEPGTQMGTVRYMSPEQLRERLVDERTDVWSFGVVLHEMVTGATPFEAPTRNETIALILKRQPPQLDSLAHMPAPFQQILEKALNKDCRRRYQTVKDMAADLKKLRRQLESATAAESLSLPSPNPAALVAGKGRRGLPEAATRPKRRLQPGATSELWSSALIYVSRTAGQILTELRDHPMMAIFAGVAAVAVIFAGLNSRWLLNRQQGAPPFQTIKMSPLTNTGQSVWAAISPDGQSVAHAEKKDGLQQLVLTGLATSGTSVIVPPDNVEYHGITFSPEGNYLYFMCTRPGKGDTGSLYQVALPGGTPRKIKDDVDGPISFSPQGDRFAFLRSHRDSREYALMIAGVDGTGERVMATVPDANTLSVGPAWSPDGKTIVCAVGRWETGYHAKLIEFEVESGREKPIASQTWYSIFQIAWLGDSSGLVVCAKEHPLSPIQLWRVALPQGEVARITNDTANYETVSLSRDDNVIVSVQNRQDGQIWVAPNGDAARAKTLASTVGRVYGLNWTRDGKIVFSAMAGNNLNLSRMDPDGSNQIQLTVNAADNYSPAMSPDGRLVVFASNRTGSLNIWRANAEDGSDPKQLTFSDGNSYPSCSPDGQWVFYDNQSGPTFSVWKVPMNGGAPVQLTNQSTRMPIVSFDNQLIACRYLATGGSRGIAIFPSNGSAPLEDLPIPVQDWQRLQWIPGRRALTYIDTVKGVSNIWSYDLGTRSSQQLTNFKTDQIFAYDWSQDFKALACLRGNESRDVTIIANQK